MAAGLRRLAGPISPLAETTIFTAVTRTLLREVWASGNLAGSFSLSLVPNGGAADATNRLCHNTPIDAASPVAFGMTQVLEPGDFLSAVCVNGIVLTISGVTGLP